MHIACAWKKKVIISIFITSYSIYAHTKDCLKRVLIFLNWKQYTNDNIRIEKRERKKKGQYC